MQPNITKAEEKVMNALWGFEPSMLGEIVQRLSGTGWSAKTVKTLLDRLCEKGAAGSERAGRRNLYYVLLEKDGFIARELGGVADRLFGGSKREMLAYFCRTEKMTREEARDIIALLEEGGGRK